MEIHEEEGFLFLLNLLRGIELNAKSMPQAGLKPWLCSQLNTKIRDPIQLNTKIRDPIQYELGLSTPSRVVLPTGCVSLAYLVRLCNKRFI